MRPATLALGCLALALASEAGATASYRLPWPEGMSFMFIQAPGGRITSHVTKSTLHAVDIGMPEGIPVLAARAGVVEAVESGQGASRDEDPLTWEGNFVQVRHADDTIATYAHLMHRRVAVSRGERVTEGQLLGYSGSSGDVAGPHLHFGVSRLERNAAGVEEEVSLPIIFHVGNPPIAFEPRAGMIAIPRYAAPAERPYFASSPRRVVEREPKPAAGEEPLAWAALLAWLAAGLAGLALYWKLLQR